MQSGNTLEQSSVDEEVGRAVLVGLPVRTSSGFSVRVGRAVLVGLRSLI